MKMNSKNIHSIKENCLEDIVGGLTTGGGSKVDVTIITPGNKLIIDIPRNALFHLITNGLVDKKSLIMDLTHKPAVDY